MANSIKDLGIVNKKNFENFIIYVINFINNNQIKGRDGLYVIGI